MFPEGISSMSMSFIHEFAKHGEKPALVFPGPRTVTYRELAQRITAKSVEFGTGRRLVAIEASNSEHAILSYLSALAAGHAVAMLPPGDIMAWEQFKEDFRPDTTCRLIADRWRVEAGSQSTDRHLHDDFCLLLSTSGSTGVSKCVRLSHDNVEANAGSIKQYLELTPNDRGLLQLPLHYSYGLSVLNSHLSAGASVFIPRHATLDPGFTEDLIRHDVTNVSMVPFGFDLLERISFRTHDLPSLRFMTVAGGRLGRDQVERYHQYMTDRNGRFFVMYGQTEATARIAFVPPEHLTGNEDTIGLPIPGGTLSLVDDDGGIVDTCGITGELVYQGPNVMMGYAAGRDDLALGAELQDLHTGDLAELTAEGFFRIVGRINRFSKIAGLRIDHDAIEQALAKRGIEAAVTGSDDHLIACYTGTTSEIRVRSTLARLSGLTPLHVSAVNMSSLPRKDNGKLDYSALHGMIPSQKAATSVMSAFEDAFFPGEVTEDDSFVSLGGDSLRCVELSLTLERHLGCLPVGWERLSVSTLSSMKPVVQPMPKIGVDLMLRALAILLVVVHHEMLWPIPGGAALMLVLAGFSLARFQSHHFVEGSARRLLRPLIAVLVPYSLILAAHATVWKTTPWLSVFLVSSFGFGTPEDHTMLPYLYWFVEIYTQVVLLFAGFACLPWARRAVAHNPYLAGLAVLAATICIRLWMPLLFDVGNRQIFTLYWNLHLVALGWCAATAVTRRDKTLLVVLAAAWLAVLGLADGTWIGTKIKYLIVFAGLSTLVLMSAVRIPGLLRQSILLLAGASYYIYLLHRLVPEVAIVSLFKETDTSAMLHVASIAGGLVLGIGAWRIERMIIGALSFYRKRLIPAPAGINCHPTHLVSDRFA